MPTISSITKNYVGLNHCENKNSLIIALLFRCCHHFHDNRETRAHSIFSLREVRLNAVVGGIMSKVHCGSLSELSHSS